MAHRPNIPIRWISKPDDPGYPSFLDSWLYWRDRLTTQMWWDKFPIMNSWASVTRDDVVKFIHTKRGTNDDGRCPQCNDMSRFQDETTGWKLWCLCQIPGWQRDQINKIRDYRSVSQRPGWGSFSTHHPDLELAKAEAFAFAEYPSKWLVLSGKWHIGKSHLLEIIAKSIGPIALYCNMASLTQSIYNSLDSGSLGELVTALQTAPILLIDDLGAEHRTKFIEDTLMAIIGYRFINPFEYPLAVATNVSKYLFKLEWGRIGARLTDSRFTFLEINAPEYQEAEHE